jgi:D-alanyl-D-alanine carboxypeptidase-like protein
MDDRLSAASRRTVSLRGVRRPAACAAATVAMLVAGCGSDPAPQHVAAAPTVTPVATATATPAPPPAARSVAVVWSLEHPRRALARVRRHEAVETATLVHRGVALLRASVDERGRRVEHVRPGYAIPLDVLMIDPRGYARTLPDEARAEFLALRPGRALISETSARLRGVGVGGRLRLLGGRTLRVAGIVDDELVRSSEVVITGSDPRVRHGDGTSVLAVLHPDASVDPDAFGRRAERGAGARVLPGGPLGERGFAGPARPAELKVQFGEPAVGLPYGDDWVRLDPAFLRRYIVRRSVPILGSVTCHRALIRPLRAALAEVRRRGLSRLVDPGDYAGCYAPRRIRPGGSLSLHAWGLAVDLNAAANPYGSDSRQDPRLVRIMLAHGFSWGGDWPTIRDPMHFEFRGR